jgi:predicted short-subunit dehydrogenase-like oxidoreductase (DUF2520 family)
MNAPRDARAPDLGRLGLIGAGRLGQTLVRACAAAGLPFEGVFSRRADPLQALHQDLGVNPAPSAQAVVDGCDTVFITVADDAIQSVCASLKWRAGQVAVHCSGATELAALRSAAQQGAVAAGFHPLHTFGDVQTALSGLPGCAVAVEASDPHTLQALIALAQTLGTRPFELPAGSRALYHASAHYAGSLVVTLMDEAVRHWTRMGVGQEQALAALLPLLRSTVRAMESRGLGPGMAGVVARGDAGVLQKHLQALGAVGSYERQLYEAISRRSVRLALESGRISAEQAQAMISLLDA